MSLLRSWLAVRRCCHRSVANLRLLTATMSTMNLMERHPAGNTTSWQDMIVWRRRRQHVACLCRCLHRWCHQWLQSL